MLFAAEELVQPGGPSAPVWAFLTAISLALIALFGQQLQAKREARNARNEAQVAAKNASTAAESATEARDNTQNISNGFANRVDRKLDAIQENQIALSKALREHITWHLENDDKKEK